MSTKQFIHYVVADLVLKHRRRLGAVLAVAGTVTIASLGAAQAAVIPGPLLNQDGSGYTTTGRAGRRLIA